MRTLSLACSVLLLTGCAGRLGRNAVQFDQIEAVRIDQLTGNNLTRTPFDQEIVYLNARCETRRDGNKLSYLFTETILPPDFTLQPGESLILNIDDDIFAFSPTNSPTAFTARPRYTSTFYKVPDELLAKLAEAKQASVRIKGINQVVDRKLAPRNLQKFRQFKHFHSALNAS